MTPQAFTVIADMLKKRAGLVFGPEKRYLVECRLSSVLRRHGFADLDALATSLRNADENLSREVTEAMTTHETSFFRDVKPFETFRHVVLPQMLQRRAASKTLRILCCAASTGQEPYSLAIILSEEQNRLRGWRWEILALDISRQVLDKAREGLYTQFEVQRGLPSSYLHKYFSTSDQHWQANPELRRKVSFTYHSRRSHALGESSPSAGIDDSGSPRRDGGAGGFVFLDFAAASGHSQELLDESGNSNVATAAP